MAGIKPLVVLLPGLDGTGILFEPFTPILENYCDVQVITYPTDTVLDYAQLIDYVAARLPRRPFILLGESFAGPIALHLAAAGAAPISDVILCVTFARYPLWWLAPISGIVNSLPIYQLRETAFSRWAMERELGTALLADVDRAVAAVRPPVMLARMRAVLSMNATPQLEQIKAPLYYMRATRDAVVRCGASRHMLKPRPDMRVEDFPTHHFLLQSMPQDAAAAIAAFAASLPGAIATPSLARS